MSYRSPWRIHERRFFYKYVSSHVAKMILATRKLRWSSPLLFNDPFDVTQELRLNFNSTELNQAIVEEMIRIYEETDKLYAPAGIRQTLLAIMVDIARDKPGLRQRIVEDLRRNVDSTARQIDALNELKRVWREYVPRMRVLCLSELNDNTAMWHHYADAYRGAVLEFEAVDQFDSAFLIARPVTYQDTPPAIANKEVWAQCMLERGTSTYKDLFTEYQYVTTTSWAYDIEWRIVSAAADGETGFFSDINFNPRELAGVYLGTQCSRDDEKEILALLSHGLEHVWAYRASVAGPAEAKFTFKRIR